MIIQFLDKFINKLIIANKNNFGNKLLSAILNLLKKILPIFSSDAERYLKLCQEANQKFHQNLLINHPTEKLFKPKHFVLQWHITERCNWRCKHCYQEDKISPDLSLEQLFHIFEQFLLLIKKWQLLPGRAELHISGGEPFVRKDLFEFLERVAEHSRPYGYGWILMSNGSLFNRENLKRLKEMGINGVQLSLEGMEKNNDEIRGKGTFKKIIEAAELLTEVGIPVNVSFTFTKKNMKDVFGLIGLCRRLGVHAINVRRLNPWGRGKELKDYMLQPQELRDYYLKIKETSEKLARKKGERFRIYIGCESGIFQEEMLAGSPSTLRGILCDVIKGGSLTIMANGDILPCRRLPITVGNALKDSIYDVYYSQPMQDLRNLDKLHPFCQKCPNFYNCFGGAKCITYACTGQRFFPDVQCWRAYKKLGEPFFGNNYETKKLT